MKVKNLVNWFLLLSILRSKRGQPLSSNRARSIKRLAVYNFLKRERFRAKSTLRIALAKKKRRFHVRPIFLDREAYGAWTTLIPIMREFDREEYFRFMRMTPESFDYLLERVSPLIQKRSQRKPISEGERLAITLRYLASGDSMASLSYLFRVSNQVISNIILETTAAIWFAIKDEVFEPISEDFWRRKSAEFESMWQFPMCGGAMDGKHCFVQKFPMRGSEHFNYKYGNSVVLFALTDAKYKFIIVDVGARGRESDGGVFARSAFGKLYNNHELQLPPPAYNEALRTHLPYVFLGDDAFPLGVHLLKPFKGDFLPPEEVVYNYRVSRARRVVENSFGILAARFRVLRKSIIGSETLVQNIILACCALHNLHLTREDSIPPKQRVYMPPEYADLYKSNGFLKEGRWRKETKDEELCIFKRLVQQEVPEGVHVNLESAHEVRENFVELFVSDPLPWQYDNVPDV
ncbi:protein ALP1-like [Thrips palmi]|uniref:Protein ALP1-like n=1 Tax=Thrips palmi TaxID=161013 RepID=A0A6P8ZPK5_THRPL|nr:protein ALP1-like [Thrips palmi]